jgi:hypothetical protein
MSKVKNDSINMTNVPERFRNQFCADAIVTQKNAASRAQADAYIRGMRAAYERVKMSEQKLVIIKVSDGKVYVYESPDDVTVKIDHDLPNSI